MTVNAQGTLSLYNDNGGFALSFIDSGQSAGGNSGGGGNDGASLTVSNSGSLTLTLNAGVGFSTIFGLYSALIGGNGAANSGSHSGDNGGSGANSSASGAQLQLTNSGAITINMSDSTVQSGGAALYAIAQGGQGGGANGGTAGTGGQSGGAAIVNLGAINITSAGSGSFGGIEAIGLGGNGGSATGGSGNYGGGGGAVSVTNSAPVNLTWQGTGSQSYGLYGILAQSAGGNGGDSSGGEDNGGNGGYTTTPPTASVTLTQGGNVSVVQTGAPPGQGAGVAALILGGAGGTNVGDRSNGGLGGSAGASGTISGAITVTDANVTTSGTELPGLLVSLQGGAGGTCVNASRTGTADCGGGAGGSTGDSEVTVSATLGRLAVSTAGTNSPAIADVNQGGAGGSGGFNGGTLSTHNAGNGAGGGNAGVISVDLGGQAGAPIMLVTTGDESPGIDASSLGGAGGAGGNYDGNLSSGSAGTAGAGGSGGAVNVALTATSVSTTGTNSPGIVARSEGAPGGAGGNLEHSSVAGSGGNGGNGGASGDVTVTLDSASSIATSGADASGIVAQSLSGAGGNSGFAQCGIDCTGGNGGAGGSTGSVSVTNDGLISTAGAAARGILAHGISGAGGSGGTGFGIFFGGGGSGASSGAVGPVTVTNNGAISTAGADSEGILAQSIAGSGGAGGTGTAVVVGVGGTASSNPVTADAGTVTINLQAGSSITTSGISGIGVLGQSVGGGGGDGGGASGVAVTVGGSGGAGGAGGTVSSTNNDDTIITTTGDVSPAFVLQSIGGGGGNAGNASSAAPFTSVAIGGKAGNGGNGGSAGLDIEKPTITTVGTKSPGLVVQSIGGGGGTGGNAFAGSVGPGFAVSVAVGGSGGAGGNGGSAQSEIYGGGLIATGQNPLLMNGGTTSQGPCQHLPCNLLPVDDYGVVVQSIGGGGGLGGSASAESLAVAVGTPETQVALAVSVAVGGTGGSGGAGGAAQFALSSGGRIITGGQGSTAVLAQSIGGGGGAGGDSSALAMAVGYFEQVPDGSASVSDVGAVSMGGNGGSGGAGGPVGVALGGSVSGCASYCLFVRDPVGSAPTSITTFGDFADGVVAQSIGGGGGNAGFGSSNTQAFGTSNNTSISVTLGSKGGIGGAGGIVQVYLFPGNGITTYGSGAVGLIAQSIGGGGGTSQGGSIDVGESFTANDTNYQVGLNLNLGTKGGSGNTGGAVTVLAQAPITTHGGDATGILAQSIGGGGGLAGSAGADASADNPIVEGLGTRQALSNWGTILQGDSNGSFASTSTVSIGGSGGTGANGGQVLVELSAPITTTGDWANGVVAQSIGGGGGKGGAAAASGTGGLSYVTVNDDIAVGGSGGSGGNGGPVEVDLNPGHTTISTAGFGAAGVIAQSVGGGGGIGADGSDSATGLLSVGHGITRGGGGGAGGSGGSVSVLYGNSNLTSIVTRGGAADGVDLQSIGGGGGTAGAGSSLFLSAFKQSGTWTLSAGGGAGSSGAGGTVIFGPQTGSNTPLAILTTGNNAFGILAQSIGGGGGLVTSQPSATVGSLAIGGNDTGNEPNNNGGSVTVTLQSQSTIATTGIGAHGIVAQSIGGGGGLIRIVNSAGDSPALTTNLPSSLSGAPANGLGGSVTVEADGSITVSGPGAIGILAQSIGSGGGLIEEGNTIYAGSPNLNVQGSGGEGGTVSVTVNGSVSATGPNGIGIFAQSTGHTVAQNGVVIVRVNGSVTGGGGTAATSSQSGSSGIWIDSPSGSNNNEGDDVVVNGSVTTVLGTAGTAILMSNGGAIYNNGTITGSEYMAGGPMYNAGTYNTGSIVQGNLENSGTVNLGIPGTSPLQTTTVTGDFTQTSSGQLVITVDSINKAASLLQVDGNATVGGLIVPSAITLLPGTLPVVTAGSLNSSASGLDSLLFNWTVASSGNTLTLTPSSNFAPRSVGLTASESSLANYLTRAWNNADTAFASRFADFSRLNSGSQYTTLLDAYSGKATEAQSIEFANSAGAILGAAMSCPVFVDQSVLLGEDNCVWVKGSGRWSDQWESGDTQGYHVANATYRLGGQHEIAPNWYLGGSFAAGETWATSNGTANGSSSGYGQTYDGSLALKHTMGPWFFAGSVAIASGSFHSDRLISLPGVSALLQSDPGIVLAGARARVGYEFAFNNWYIRPYGDFDVVYTHLGGFEESGPPLYALNVRGSSKTSVVLSPMVEFGGRLILDDKTTLRPFVAVGVSILPNNTRTIDASFVGASPDDGTFRSLLDGPGATGDFDVGVQLYRAGGFEVKAEYTANIGGSFASQGASARLAYHF